MQCSPSYDSNWCKQNGPTACWQQLHPRYWAIKMSQQPRDCVGRDTETPNYVGSEGLGPSNPNQQKDTPFNILPIIYTNAKIG